MTTYSWTGAASTDFGDAANWVDTATGVPGGVPGARDTVELAGSGDITGTGTVRAIDVEPVRSLGWTLDGRFASRTVSDLGTLTLAASSAFGAPTQLLADTVNVAGEDSSLTLAGAILSALDGRLDVLVSTANPSGAADAQLALGSSDGGEFGQLDLGSGTATIGDGQGQVGALWLSAGVVSGGAASLVVVGRDGASGDLYNTSVETALSAGALVVGDSGTGLAVFHDRVTLTLGRGDGPALTIGTEDRKGGGIAGSGALDASAGTITLDGLAQVGEAGQGSLTLSYTVLDTQRGLVVGDAAGAQGSVSLTEAAWTDTGDVVVGRSGQGSLLITGSGQSQGTYGVSTIDGNVRIGVAAGTGGVTLQGTTLHVAGNTVLGASHQDTISLQAAEWDSAGHSVRLLGAAATGPFHPSGDTVTLQYGSSLVAGFLSVGLQDSVVLPQGGLLALGDSASGTAAAIDGTVILGQGSTLTALGNVRVSHSTTQQSGLTVYGGSATLTASRGYALTLAAGGLATLESGASLSAQGGILLDGGAMLQDGGTVEAQSSGIALHIESGGVMDVQSGTLDTHGRLVIDASHPAPHVFAPGGELLASAGATLASTAATPGGVAVAFTGGTAQIDGAQWSVDGRFEVGASGHGGSLSAQSARIVIDGALLVGGARSEGAVTTADTDTVVSGGALADGQTGIAASSIVVGHGGSITTGALEVGSASSQGSLGIDGGSVHVAGAADIDGVLRLGHGGLLQAETITVAASSTVLGSGTLSGSIADSGAITVDRGTLLCLGPVSGGGVLRVTDGTLQLAAINTTAVTFGAAGTLVTPSVADLAGTLSGWQAGDAILFGQTIASDSFAHGTLSLYGSGGTLLGTEVFLGGLGPANFVLTAGQGTTLLGYHG